MTLAGFAEKWAHKKLPTEISHQFGACIAVLEHVGLSKEEISELVSDVIDLSRHLETEEGLAEFKDMEEEDLI